jgi:hypothetical protein
MASLMPLMALEINTPDAELGGHLDQSKNDPVRFEAELARLRRDPTFIVLDQPVSAEEALIILQENPGKRIAQVEKPLELCVYYKLRPMKVPKSERLHFSREIVPQLVIEPPIGPYQADDPEQAYAGDFAPEFPGADRRAIQMFADQNGGRYSVNIYLLTPDADTDLVEHEMMRLSMYGKVSTDTFGESLVVDSLYDFEMTYHATVWRTADKVIRIRGPQRAKKLVQAFVEKYPSVLPEKYKFDKIAWGLYEIQLNVGTMRESVDEADQNLVFGAAEKFATAASRLGRYTEPKGYLNDFLKKKRDLFSLYINDGKNPRQDYETYYQEILKLRRETLATAEAFAEAAKTGLVFDKKSQAFMIRDE